MRLSPAIVLSTLVSVGLTSCAAPPTDVVAEDPPPPTRIYATIVSHNETDTNTLCRENLNHDPAQHAANRVLLQKLVDGVVARGAAFDQQSDYAWLANVADPTFETAALTATTDGKNIVEYMATVDPEHVVVDAHHHEDPFPNGENWADVTERLNALGAPDTGVVGGFIFSPATDSLVEQMQGYAASGLTATRSSKVWYPTILWGGGSADHAGDDDTASGVWRPTSNADYYTDDPSQALVNVGHYTGELDFTGLADLVAKYQAGALEEGAMYTVTLMTLQCAFTEEQIDSILAEVDRYSSQTAEGWLVWKTLDQVAYDWQTVYRSTPHIYQP